MKYCEICGVDISERQPHAIYCRECYKELNRQRSVSRIENMVGTTFLGQHTKIKEINGKIVGVDKEQRIIKNELKILGLKKYIKR